MFLQSRSTSDDPTTLHCRLLSKEQLVHTVDETLNELITAGTRQGHLKFSQIFNYLPNENQ